MAEGKNPRGKEIAAAAAKERAARAAALFDGEKVAETGASTGLFVGAIPKSKKRRSKKVI